MSSHSQQKLTIKLYDVCFSQTCSISPMHHHMQSCGAIKLLFLVANFKENVQRCITVLDRRILCYEIKEEVSCNYRSWNKLLCFSRPTLGKMRTLKLQRKRQKLLVQKRYQNIISLVFRSTFSLSFDAHYCIRVNPPPRFSLKTCVQSSWRTTSGRPCRPMLFTRTDTCWAPPSRGPASLAS